MENRAADETGDPISENLYRVGLTAGSSDLLDASGVSEEAIDEIAELMNALARLREAESRLSEASRKYMRLSEQDMRALHYLIVAKRQGEIVTPGMLATHLRISAASTTKLLNRLERDHHIVRHVHPRDRRAFMIEITPETEASAKQTVGRQQARRFYAAARLTSSERAAVTRFLTDMTNEISLRGADWADDPSAPRAAPPEE
ncbi:MarR family transcriptional regulator [Leucobacter sp. CSA1]|uniref:MarR family transcriptional regulator n=1 Tax=Leucobacter chromiisoli TaxID=2796471 RepID=A0A934QA52_9MICO|nr:MarR family transcriptional regulator [Leucobacter chromiisoli]MBK0419424.1 MarR family transcriptional regulator [Leucobacter chromiisoli]